MMKIKLDLQLNKELRDKINDINHFSVDKTAKFQFPSNKKGDKQESNAFNCICAALDRIDDLVEHCNTLDLTQSKEGIFALCDLFNYGQTLIDCITRIGEVYAIEDRETEDFSFIDEPFTLDCSRLNEMLDIMDKAIKAGFTYKDLKCQSICLDKKYQVNDSEWARIQLKIMSTVLEKFIKFDYCLNDWHLYLQVEIAKWLLKRNGV